MCGGLLAFLGLTASFFATSIPFLVVSVGVVSGFGMSLAFVSSVTSVGEHFKGRTKLLAISFIGTGSSSGAILLPFMLDFLIDRYGWRGCLLIMGGLVGNMICFFGVCEPLSIRRHRGNGEIRQTESRSGFIDSQKKPQVNTFTSKLKSVTRNTVFTMFCIGISLTLSAFGSSLVYLVDFLQTKGYDEDDALVLYLYMNVCNAFGRLVPGMCTLVPHIKVLLISAVFTTLSCLTSICLPIASTYYQHVLLVCTFGMTIGCNDTCMSMTTMKLVGLDRYAVGLGVLMAAAGLSCICAGALSGWLVDISGSYDASYYSVAGAHGLAVCLFTVAAILQKCNRRKTLGVYVIGR